MVSKTLRKFMCTALAAGFAMFGTASHAVVHSLPFDPDNFLGIVTVDIPVSCLTPTSSTNSCLIAFLSVDFTDNYFNHWITGTPFSETDLIDVDSVGAFVGLQATLGFDFLILAGDSQGIGCLNSDSTPTQTLTFGLPSVNDGQHKVTFSCNNSPVSENTGNYKVVQVQVPEPASLALLSLGLVGLAVSRRRKLY